MRLESFFLASFFIIIITLGITDGDPSWAGKYVHSSRLLMLLIFLRLRKKNVFFLVCELKKSSTNVSYKSHSTISGLTEIVLFF